MLALTISEQIKQFQSQHLDGFLTSELAAAENTKKVFLQTEEKRKEAICALSESSKSLRETLAQQTQRAVVEKGRVDALQVEVSALEARRHTYPQQLQELAKEQERKKAVIEAKNKEIAEVVASRETIVAELTKAVRFFKDRLGLEFVCLQGGLRISFQFIDPSDVTRVFSFVVLVDQNNQYQVSECNPPVCGLEALIAALNAQNDFSAFVQAMRRQFKAQVQPVA